MIDTLKMMKTITAILLTLFTMTGNAQIKVEVSETVELMAILSRTAGFREYCMDLGGQYTKETEEWFSPFHSHPAITYCQDLRAKHGISYDAVMNMAINLEADGRKVTMTGGRNSLEKRWQDVEIDTFLVRLNQF